MFSSKFIRENHFSFRLFKRYKKIQTFAKYITYKKAHQVSKGKLYLQGQT